MSERITMDIWQELYDNAVAVKNRRALEKSMQFRYYSNKT